MHCRLVVLCKGYVDRWEVTGVEARLERRLVVRKRVFDYVGYMERAVPLHVAVYARLVKKPGVNVDFYGLETEECVEFPGSRLPGDCRVR